MKLQSLADYLESYGGRDRVMRIIYYSTQLIGGLTKSKGLQEKMEILGDQINSCRTVLRLFDDVPMLAYTLSYGLGREESDGVMRLCGLGGNLLDQLYYPLEHVAWAADSRLLPLQSGPWWTASCLCWALSMYLSVVKSLRYYFILRNLKNLVKPEHSATGGEIYSRLSEVQRTELLTALRCCLDLVEAVHWLPTGTLWAGRLSVWQLGFLGVLSSLLSIYLSSG